jgi:hypothetical protein
LLGIRPPAPPAPQERPGYVGIGFGLGTLLFFGWMVLGHFCFFAPFYGQGAVSTSLISPSYHGDQRRIVAGLPLLLFWRILYKSCCVKNKIGTTRSRYYSIKNHFPAAVSVVMLLGASLDRTLKSSTS